MERMRDEHKERFRENGMKEREWNGEREERMKE